MTALGDRVEIPGDDGQVALGTCIGVVDGQVDIRLDDGPAVWLAAHQVRPAEPVARIRTRSAQPFALVVDSAIIAYATDADSAHKRAAIIRGSCRVAPIVGGFAEVPDQ